MIPTDDELVPTPPDLAGDPETARVHARVIAALFGDDEPGARIGRYAVRGKLGQGAMGIVYEAYDDALDRSVAIKIVRNDVDAATVRARLVREGQALARTNHPNVVHVYEVGDDEGRVFVAMELVHGSTLREWVRARRRSAAEVLAICIAAGRGLAAVHAQGLTHRDFKPDNVLVGHDGRVRVMDFGLARFDVDAAPLASRSWSDATDMEATGAGRVVGTPAYMAPEQWRSSVVDAASDQYSFCVTVWEALFGRRPFAELEHAEVAVPPSATARRVPAWVRAVLARGLRGDPKSRWPSMTSLLDELERGRVRARRRGRIVVLSALASFFGVLALAYGIDRSQRERACEREGDLIADDAGADARDEAPQAWRAARTEACRRADVEQSWDDVTAARSRWCLDEVRARISVDHAFAADGSLATCLDAHALTAISVPPRAHLDEAREIAAMLWTERLAPDADAEVLAALVDRADALGFAPLQAATRTVRAQTLVRAGDMAAAEATATEAYFIAAQGDAWPEASAAAVLLHEIAAREPDRGTWTRHAAVADALAR